MPCLTSRRGVANQPPGCALDGPSRDGATPRGGVHFPREVLLNAGPQRQAFPGNSISTAKYSLLSFAPRFLFQLFSRVAYMYFLVQAALTWWSAVSPFDPWGSTAALAFVVAVAAVSELWQDVRRHRADYEINNRTTRVMHANGSFRKVPWRNVRVGDVLWVADEEEVPCDLLCLFCSLRDRVCFIQTTNLDGETNLKIRRPVLQACNGSCAWTPQDVSSAARLRGRVLTEPPSAALHSFAGAFELWAAPGPHGDTPPGGGDDVVTSVAVNLEEVLLRGCKLKNSDFVVGVALYTGPETRIHQNTCRRSPLKVGAYDQFLNVQLFALIGLQVAVCVALAVASWAWREQHERHYYFVWSAHSTGKSGNNAGNGLVFGVISFLTFWVLLSYLVPVSLFVSMEIVSLAQGVLFISRDVHMRDPVTQEPAVARNTDLNEDLGHITHVFSDKTGTLTCNDMRLRALLLDGQLLGTTAFKLEACSLPPAEAMRAFDARLADAVQSDSPAGARQSAVELLTAVAVCHTLIVDAAAPVADGTQSPGDARPMYTGPSPDEVALADGARLLGVHFASRTSRGVTLNILDTGTGALFEQLAVLEFTPERQRMSVVVRRPDGRITLFCKGADTALLPRLTPAAQLGPRGLDILKQTERGLHTLATQGLRTLVVASRELSGDEWAALAPAGGTDATSSAEWQALVERDLTLLGATGVDDQLQDGVRDTVGLLLQAGIKVWVLTGDKQETAITISASCGLLDPASVLVLNADSPVEAAARMQALREACARASPGAWELVVDGQTLAHILGDTALASTFAALGASARAVCVCRCSPRQKSAVVKLMQRHRRRTLRAQQPWWHALVGQPPGRTLAIGDGANDVAMLQAADVGVGIAGKEGRQAVNVADYGISQFRFLARLLLVHGTLCRYRLTRLIKYSFYKNIAFCCLLFFFQFYAGFSGQALYDSISAGLFNVVLTSAPVVAFALLDRPLSDAGLLAHPQAYNTAHSLSGRTFWKTLLDACVHGAICFFFALYGVPSSGGVRADALSGMLQVGKVAYTSILATVTLELCLHCRYVTALFAGITLLSVALWPLLLWLVPVVAFVNEFEAMAPLLFSSPSFWLTVTLSAGAATAYRLAWLALVNALAPSDLDLLHEGEVLGAPSQHSRDAEAGHADGQAAGAEPVVE